MSGEWKACETVRRFRLHAACGGALGDGRDAALAARDDDARRSVDRRDADLGREAGDQLAGGLLVGEHGRHRAGRAAFGHQAAARATRRQASSRRRTPERVAATNSPTLWPTSPPARRRASATSARARTRSRRSTAACCASARAARRRRPREPRPRIRSRAARAAAARAAGRVARALVEGFAERRHLAVQLAPHAGVLRALSGEEEDDVGARFSVSLAALGRRPVDSATRDGGVSRSTRRSAFRPDQREAVLEVVAADARTCSRGRRAARRRRTPSPNAPPALAARSACARRAEQLAAVPDRDSGAARGAGAGVLRGAHARSCRCAERG